MEAFSIDVNGKICADLGCSTGGFTDCLLQRGARKVYSVDTGYGVLDWGLRNDERVVVLERTNALHVALPEPVDFICIDASWTRQRLLIPKALELLKKEGDIVTLLKPHYEAAARHLRAGKLLDDKIDETLQEVMDSLQTLAEVAGGPLLSPLVGKKGGNAEYLVWLKPRKEHETLH